MDEETECEKVKITAPWSHFQEVPDDFQFAEMTRVQGRKKEKKKEKSSIKIIGRAE